MKHLALILAAVAAMTFAVHADDADQLGQRVDPTLEADNGRMANNYAEFPFLNLDANRVVMNGADWTALRQRYQAAARGEAAFSLVYLGDSHIQADFGGTILRERLARDAGSAGRGLIIPFRAAGTNQPVDYNITTRDPVVTSRLLKQPWATEMTFTGIGIQPVGNTLTLSVHSDTPFKLARVLASGTEPHIGAVYGDNVADIPDHAFVGPNVAVFAEPRTDINLRLDVSPTTTIAGIVLESEEHGTFVHSIGNNGATFETYATVPVFGREVARLAPDLFVIALGTNEAFGQLDPEAMEASIATLLGSIRRHCPDAAIMLVTPPECYRKKRSRRRNPGLTVNRKVAVARNVIKEYAESHGIPLYDTFEVAGGNGAASAMRRAQVLGRDGVHYTPAGYRLWGGLLSDALLEQLKSISTEGR